jgi:hypothetical protein
MVQTQVSDKEKLLALSQFLGEGVTMPKVESQGAQNIVADAAVRLCNLAEEIFQATEKM